MFQPVASLGRDDLFPCRTGRRRRSGRRHRPGRSSEHVAERAGDRVLRAGCSITGAQLPRPPYSSAGTLEFQHLEGGAWRAGGTELAFSDALAFIVRPSLAGSMDLVSATAVDGPD